jgi:hypothetical protein
LRRSKKSREERREKVHKRNVECGRSGTKNQLELLKHCAWFVEQWDSQGSLRMWMVVVVWGFGLCRARWQRVREREREVSYQFVISLNCSYMFRQLCAILRELICAF